MIPVYAASLEPKAWPTNVKAQKINSSTFKIFEMVIASFEFDDKLKMA